MKQNTNNGVSKGSPVMDNLFRTEVVEIKPYSITTDASHKGLFSYETAIVHYTRHIKVTRVTIQTMSKNKTFESYSAHSVQDGSSVGARERNPRA